MSLSRPERMLRRNEVELRCGLACTTIYRLMMTGGFPRPVKVGPRAVRWPESEIEAWLAARPRSHGDSA